MNQEKLRAAGINYEEGVHRCAGDEALYRDLLVLMVQDKNFEQAQAALDDDDFDKLFSRCHEIKGMSGTVSFTDVYKLSSRICELYRAGDFDAIEDEFGELAAAYKRAIEAVQDGLEQDGLA